MASHRVVETLTRTGGLCANVTRRRLLETFQHILDVTRDVESVQPGGKGFASSIRVRLLHASVRRRILALVREKPSYFDVEAYGVPINDLDSIATVISFSANLIWVGFPAGHLPARGRSGGLLGTVALGGAHTGTPTDVFATPARARAMMESLLLSEIAPMATGQILANNINRKPRIAAPDIRVG